MQDSSSSKCRLSGENGPAAGSFDSVAVSDWTPEHVVQWLDRIGLRQYGSLFVSAGVTGSILLQLDSSRLKVHLLSTIKSE